MLTPYSHKPDYLKYKKEYMENIETEIENGDFINGGSVRKLEKKLQSFLNIKHALGVSSGTDALLIALMALGVKGGDEIITTPFTWISTSSVILLLGAIPVFVDIEPETYNIDPSKIEESITEKTKIILPVSIFGHTCDLEKINIIAKKHKLYVIEDAAQSFGASKSCKFSDIACTSFYPTKPLGCWGDAGACFTNNSVLDEKMRCIMNHGGVEKIHIGINGRMDSIQACILNIKLDHFEESLKDRVNIANVYNKELVYINELVLPKTNIEKHIYAQYTVLLNDRRKRNEFIEYMATKNIVVKSFYPKLLYREKCMLRYKKYCPVAEEICDRCVSLTLYDGLKEEEQNLVIKEIKLFFRK